MKKYILILIVIGSINLCKAQDQLFKKDNSKLLVKVTEVSPEEIKYKLFNNLNGPTYVVSKSEVALLIYENGQHEVMNTSAEPLATPQRPMKPQSGMNKSDSLKYYKYQSSLALNFFSFINSEVGLIYQREFLKSNLNIIIPIAVGLDKPIMTESIYFQNGNGGIQLKNKLFEVGFGINYYPSLRFPVNYYVGPAFRYMQYACKQTYTYYTPSTPPSYPNYNTPNTIVKHGTLSSYCYSITNGFIFRTRSRLMLNLFGSLGFKSDVISTKIVDPVSNREINAITNPVSLYFWTGFAVGFCF